jgi:cyclase
MRSFVSASFLVLCLALASSPRSRAADNDLPKMKFNEVKQIAPGVFFRYSAISATDKSVVFGGSNNVWVVFER